MKSGQAWMKSHWRAVDLIQPMQSIDFIREADFITK